MRLFARLKYWAWAAARLVAGDAGAARVGVRHARAGCAERWIGCWCKRKMLVRAASARWTRDGAGCCTRLPEMVVE